MEVLVIVVIAAVGIWWFFLRDPLEAKTKETLVAPYKTEAAPVVDTVADVDTVIVTPEAVAPTLIADTIVTNPTPVAKKANTVKKPAGIRPAAKKVTSAASKATKPRTKKV